MEEKAALHLDTALCSNKSQRYMINVLIYINEAYILFTGVSDIKASQIVYMINSLCVC